MDRATLHKIFEKAYHHQDWLEVLQSVFGARQLYAQPKPIILPNNERATAAFELGSFTTSDDRIIGLYRIDVKSDVWLERNKVSLRELLRNVYKYDVDGAIVVFVQDEKWRLSFISEIKVLNDEGEIIKQATEPKRYTYLLGKGEKVRTPAERFFDVAGKKLYLEDIRSLFSVSTLTKEFYNELFKWYQWVLTEEVGITFPKNPNTTEDDREKLEEQIIRLITRLLFVWFIKQKQLVPDSLFDVRELKKILKELNPQSNTEGNYYNAILQNLFFATLNKAIDERAFAKTKTIRDIKTLYRYDEMFSISENEIIDLFKSIPFLNGGLFECLDKEDAEGKKYFLDGFSRNDKRSANGNFKHRAFIPNTVFFHEEKGIIPLLQRYNFTVEEHAPEDVQVALDPELLGNVFENLLGAFNSETKETARKQSGSFYTPREIVDYMVSESLQAYCLNLDLPDAYDKNDYKKYVNELFDKHSGESFNHKNHSSDHYAKFVYDALLKVKILDPACGSGAFPMGILNGIIALLEKIGVAEKLDMYKLKLHLIENCIYGVDLQTIAAQISKLRFFISLIVEQGEKDLTKKNYGVITLPNLETKFVAANTLLGVKKKKEGDFVATLFEDPQIEVLKKSLLEIRHKHFSPGSVQKKKELRKEDKEFREELAILLEQNGDYAPEDAKQLALWNPYDQNSSSPFFDAEWMFGLKSGFDVVIGNPPYIQLQNDGGKLAKQYQHCEYKTFARTGDIYSLFYEKGWQLLKPKGVLSFITSNKWMRAGYGESTRKFFAEHTNPLLLIDFAGQKIFESATVDVNILMFAKDKNRQQTKACIVKEKLLNKLSDFVRQEASDLRFTNSDSWVVLSDIEQRIKAKIEAVGTPLKDWDINIYRGILTGYNEAFIISGEKKQEILANCKTAEELKKTDELIRPILRGRDIKRYGYNYDERYLIATFPSRSYNIDDYPALKCFLEGFKPKLKQTGEALTSNEIEQVMAHAKVNGIPLKEKDLKTSRKRTNNKWFETQDSISYWDDFSKQKIVWKRVGSILRFSYDETGAMALDSTCFATGNHIKFLVAILNSKMGNYLMKDAPQTGTGDLLISVQAIEPLKIPIPNSTTEVVVEGIINKILNQENTDLGKELNQIVYDLYKLSKEEVRFIESQ